MRRLGIFGGTFDPPHLGHLILSAEACDQLHLDQVLWVLTPQPPHKQGMAITPVAHRLNMVRAAIADEPRFTLSQVELERPGPHFALDTIHLLQEEYPEAKLIYLIGGDSLRDLPTWHRAQNFVNACHALGVMRRPGDVFDWTVLEQVLPGLRQKTLFVEAPLLEIAARDIRRRVSEKRPYRYYLPPAVLEVIQKNRLYQKG